jgi:hypothetical protein
MTPLGLVLGGAALVGIGVAVGARAAEQGLPRVLSYLLRTEIRLGHAEHRVRRLERQLANAEEAFASLSATFDQTVKLAARIAYDNGVEEGQAFEAQRRQAGLS